MAIIDSVLAKPRPAWFRGIVVNGAEDLLPPEYLLGGAVVPPTGDECFDVYFDLLDALSRYWSGRLSPSSFVLMHTLAGWTLAMSRSWVRVSLRELQEGLWGPEGTCVVAPLALSAPTIQRAIDELQARAILVAAHKEGESPTSPFWYLIDWVVVFEYRPTKPK